MRGARRGGWRGLHHCGCARTASERDRARDLEALGIKPPRLRLPYALLYGAAAACEFVLKPFPVSAPLHRRRAAWFNSTREFDISKARQRLGYDPKIAPEDGLKEMVRSYQAAGML